MPTQETQVYWHELPVKISPWNTEADLRASMQASREAAEAHQRETEARQAAAVGGLQLTASPLETQRNVRLRLPQKKRTQRTLRASRQKATRHIEQPFNCHNVVAEPHATSLDVLNLIMQHMRQPTISLASFREAIESVSLNFMSLTQQTQQSQSTHPANGPAEETPGHHRRRRDRPAASSVLSQSQHTAGDGGTQPHTAAASSQNQRGAGLMVQVRRSLTLDVIETVCSANHALRFTRLSQAKLAIKQRRVGSRDLEAHRRVVVLADPSEPIFAVMFEVKLATQTEPFVEATLRVDGRSPEVLQRYTREPRRCTEVFVMAHAPTPWRCLFDSVSISTIHNDFAVGVIELVADEEDGASRPQPSEADPLQPSRKRHAEDLLGAGPEEEDFSRPRQAKAAADAEASLPSAVKPVEWLMSYPDPIFKQDTAATGTEGDVAGVRDLVEDPLQDLPRQADQRLLNPSMHRVWYRRLLTRHREHKLQASQGALDDHDAAEME